ncbi:MAG: methyltransferase domain-containing protein [Pirellulaceae bacterium]|nr:methyltransferase domain-containing protein [Pirellulaceae bacterium]
MSDAQYIHGTAPDEQRRLAELNRLTNPAFLDFLELRPGDRVLEVGSGLGILAGEVARRVPQGRVLGVELSTEQLAQAQPAANLSFLQGDAHHLPLESDSFDVVYCRYLLEHVADPPRVLAEMRRVLRPGGQIFLQENNILIHDLWPACPRFAAIWQKFAALQTRLGGDALIGKKLFALLRQAGFAEIRLSLASETHAAGEAGFAAWVENLIGNVASGRAALVLHGLASEAEIDGAMAELRAFRSLPDAAAYFYWNRAAAVKS